MQATLRKGINIIRSIILTGMALQAQQSPQTGYGADKLNPVQIISGIIKSDSLSVSEMLCEINDFLGRETRTVTCGISANKQSYTGTLRTVFTDKTFQEKLVFVEQPLVDGVMATWGIAAMGVYGTKDISQVEFISNVPLAIWESTSAAKKVLDGTYNYPKADTYPPPVKINEMLCHVSEFLVGKSQNTLEKPNYVATCGISGSSDTYGGKLAVWWHQFESRIPEKGDKPNIPANLSTGAASNYNEHFTIRHDKFANGAYSYWGIVAFQVVLDQKTVFDRFNFYLDSEEITWTSATAPANYSTNKGGICKIFHFLNSCKKLAYIHYN